MKLTIILLNLLLALSCDQNMLGAGSGIKNVLTTPFRSVSNAFSNKAYNNISTNKLDESSLNKVQCDTELNAVLGESEDLENLLSGVRENACQCRPWGSCTTKECSCDNLCPDSFEIFNRRRIDDNSTESNSLAFRLGGIQSDNHQMTAGYCWGHASVTAQFNRLAFFKPDAKGPNLYSTTPKEYHEAMKFYKKKIDQIVNNEATDIPGVLNLYELSSHPELQGYLGDKIAKSWADKAATFQGLRVGLNSKGNTREKNLILINSIKDKIDNNQQPQIVFTQGGEKFKTHTTLVSHYKEVDGQTRLCVRDSNNQPTENQSCTYYMELLDDGSIKYNDPMWNGRIGGIELAHNDNADAVEQFKSLKKKCAKDKNCN